MLATRSMRLLSSLLVIAFVGIGTLATTACEEKVCTLMGCGAEGVTVEFTLRERGAYVIDVVVDGERTTCRATLPLRADDSGCGGSAVVLTRSGSALPESEHTIGPLRIASTTAREVSIRLERDGTVVAEKSFSPAYETTPGPNGPECDPASCTSARTTLP